MTISISSIDSELQSKEESEEYQNTAPARPTEIEEGSASSENCQRQK